MNKGDLVKRINFWSESEWSKYNPWMELTLKELDEVGIVIKLTIENGRSMVVVSWSNVGLSHEETDAIEIVHRLR